MIFYISVITLTIFIICNLIGLYYFSKQEYINRFVGLLLNQENLKLLELNKTSQKNYKKIKFILNIQTIILIVLLLIFIYVFESYNLIIIYLVAMLIAIIRFISNKLMEIIL